MRLIDKENLIKKYLPLYGNYAILYLSKATRCHEKRQTKRY